MYVVLFAWALGRTEDSPSLSATAIRTPVEVDLEFLPTLAIKSVKPTRTHAVRPPASPSATPGPSSQGSEKILFVSDRDGNEEIYVMNLDGSHPTRLTQNPGRDIDPQWSPDGTKIAFLSERENQRGLYVMNMDGSQQTLLASSPVFGKGEFSWSPDSIRLAYSSLVGGHSDISVVSVDRSRERNLTATATKDERNPSWSPDGTKIAFHKSRYHYFIMNSDGSGPRGIVISPDFDWSQPQWSPNSLYLLVSTAKEVFSVSGNTNAVIPLTKNQNYDGSAAASPDGTKIAFVSSRSGGSHEIFVMSANGENAEKLSNIYDTRASISNLLWSPRGDRILFTIRNYKGRTTAEILSIDLSTGETVNLSQNPSSSNDLSDVAS